MSRWSNLTIDKNEKKYEIKIKYEIMKVTVVIYDNG